MPTNYKGGWHACWYVFSCFTTKATINTNCYNFVQFYWWWWDIGCNVTGECRTNSELLLTNIHGYNESYNLDDSDIMEEEGVTMDDGIKNHTFIVFESQLMTPLHRCHTCSCGIEVKLETSVVGTLFMVNYIRPNGYVLHWQWQPMVRGMAAGNLLLPAAILHSRSVASPLLALLIWPIC